MSGYGKNIVNVSVESVVGKKIGEVTMTISSSSTMSLKQVQEVLQEKFGKNIKDKLQSNIAEDNKLRIFDPHPWAFQNMLKYVVDEMPTRKKALL